MKTLGTFLSRRVRFSLALISVALIGASCVTTIDVSYDRSYNTDYAIGQIYRLKQPLFVEKLGAELVLTKPGDIQSGPLTVEEYRKAPAAKWPGIVGVLNSGASIRIKKLELVKHFETGNIVWVKGEILSDALGGKIVELLFVSREIHQRKPEAAVPMVNPDFFELVDSRPK